MRAFISVDGLYVDDCWMCGSEEHEEDWHHAFIMEVTGASHLAVETRRRVIK